MIKVVKDEKGRIKFDYLAIGVFLITFTLLAIRLCYAQSEPGANVIAPEPGTLALLSTTGFFGFLVRFARKRFQEFKRMFDVTVSLIGLIISLPVVALTAAVIKIVSPGSVFFKQERVGLNGEVFYIYKLRTMRLDAEKDTGPMWAKEDDPRLIKFGKFMRKSHVDELPQLFNVLKGEMSIVGPRPERPVFVDKLSGQIKEYNKRITVKPGITGLAQVWHKYDETLRDVKKKIKLDLLYIRKMCLWVDMRILALTVVAVLTGKGAR